MTTHYKIGGVDTDTLFIRKDPFIPDYLWTWGYNSKGQLGDGTAASKSSSVQTITGGTNWSQVSVGYLSTAAIQL